MADILSKSDRIVLDSITQTPGLGQRIDSSLQNAISEGITGAYDAAFSYQIGDLATINGILYISTANNNVGNSPPSPGNWTAADPGLQATYDAGQSITVDGSVHPLGVEIHQTVGGNAITITDDDGTNYYGIKADNQTPGGAAGYFSGGNSGIPLIAEAEVNNSGGSIDFFQGAGGDDSAPAVLMRNQRNVSSVQPILKFVHVNDGVDFAFTDTRLADPSGASLVEAGVWYNATDKKVKYFDGTSVIEVGGGGAGVWDSGTIYKTNDYAFFSQSWYKSLQNNNTNHQPNQTANAAWWQIDSYEYKVDIGTSYNIDQTTIGAGDITFGASVVGAYNEAAIGPNPSPGPTATGFDNAFLSKNVDVSGLAALAVANVQTLRVQGEFTLAATGDAGTAQGNGGGADTIQLQGSASPVNSYYNGMIVNITGGTTVQSGTILSYDGATRIATMTAPWGTNDIDGTSTYTVTRDLTVVTQSIVFAAGDLSNFVAGYSVVLLVATGGGTITFNAAIFSSLGVAVAVAPIGKNAAWLLASGGEFVFDVQFQHNQVAGTSRVILSLDQAAGNDTSDSGDQADAVDFFLTQGANWEITLFGANVAGVGLGRTLPGEIAFLSAGDVNEDYTLALAGPEPNSTFANTLCQFRFNNPNPLKDEIGGSDLALGGVNGSITTSTTYLTIDSANGTRLPDPEKGGNVTHMDELLRGGRVWNATFTYTTGNVTSDGGSVFVSLQNANINHATSDTAWWKPVGNIFPTITLGSNTQLTASQLPATLRVSNGAAAYLPPQGTVVDGTAVWYIPIDPSTAIIPTGGDYLLNSHGGFAPGGIVGSNAEGGYLFIYDAAATNWNLCTPPPLMLWTLPTEAVLYGQIVSWGGVNYIAKSDLGAQESTYVAALANVAASLQNKYVTFCTPNTSFYFWFNVAGLGVDPAPGGTGIEVALSGDKTDVEVATAIRAALNAYTIGITATDNFLTVANGAVLSIVNLQVGAPLAPATNGTSGFAVVPSGVGVDSPDPSVDNGVNYFPLSIPSGSGSPTAANDMTLAYNVPLQFVGGATAINRIASAGWSVGNVVILEFASNPVVADGVASGGGFATIKLAGSAPFATAANSRLQLYWNGTYWMEISRTTA